MDVAMSAERRSMLIRCRTSHRNLATECDMGSFVLIVLDSYQIIVLFAISFISCFYFTFPFPILTTLLSFTFLLLANVVSQLELVYRRIQ